MSFPKHTLRVRRLKRWLAPASLALLLPCFSTETRAASIIYTATDVANTTPGQDLWEYSYQISQFAFAAGQGFTIFFDRTLFTQIQSPPPPVNPGWDLISLQPDLLLGSDGFYDGLALVNNPSLADAFKVKVVWLGTGSPGAQPFNIYDTDFSTISSAQTTPVPEPATTALLILSGLAVTSLRRPRRAER